MFCVCLLTQSDGNGTAPCNTTDPNDQSYPHYQTGGNCNFRTVEMDGVGTTALLGQTIAIDCGGIHRCMYICIYKRKCLLHCVFWHDHVCVCVSLFILYKPHLMTPHLFLFHFHLLHCFLSYLSCMLDVSAECVSAYFGLVSPMYDLKVKKKRKETNKWKKNQEQQELF